MKQSHFGRRTILLGKLLIIFFVFSSTASATDTGWVAPSANVGGSGVTNPANAYIDNSNYANFASDGAVWNWYGYALSSIPAGSTINGIEVNAKGREENNCNSCLMRLRLSNNSGTTWTSYIDTTSSSWSTAISNHTTGSPTNNWGRSWTRDEIVNSFRVQAYWQESESGSVAGRLYYLPVRIYYTPGASSTYNISGYITNKTSGTAINGATVEINTTPTPTSKNTNITGYYNFSGISNGTYLISASASGYSANSTVTVVNGNNRTNINISLTPTSASPGGDKILVSTNRYVILDDFVTGSFGTGFSTPGKPGTRTDWTGINTMINATVLYIDNSGFPIQGRNITFIITNPGGTSFIGYNTTNLFGLATYALDLNTKNYYGNWTVKASNGSINDSTGFIYNWWGCGMSSGCGGYDHSGKSPAGTSTKNSPYLSGREKIHDLHGTHDSYASQCTDCHQSYDGKPGGNTANDANHIMNTQDVHRNLTCVTAGCHLDSGNHNSNQVIGSCYSATCHTPANRADISAKSTLSTSNVANALSLYSSSSTAFNATFHTSDSTVPCTMCHGPMHNITKPDVTQRFIRNTVTEPSQCWACHTKRPAHFGENCVGCHTQDAHKVSLGGGPDCIACHDVGKSAQHRINNAAMSLGVHAKINSGAIVGTGISPDNKKCWGCHQSDGTQPTGMGNKYSNPYKCYECHGTSKPYTGVNGALNASEHFKGGFDIIAAETAPDNSTSCTLCHNLSEMKVTYTEDDAFRSNYSLASHYDKNRSDIHSSNETNCAYCHKNLTTAFKAIFRKVSNTNITHNNGQNCLTCHRETGSTDGRIHDSALLGGGGPDCKSCHDLANPDVLRHIDFSAAALGEHGSINATIDSNGACWACHQTDGKKPSGMGDRAYMPYLCPDCHLKNGIVSGIFNASIVDEHFKNGSNITAVTGAATDVLSCVKCHQKPGMLVPNNDQDNGTYDSDNNGIFGGATNPYVYGKKRTDMLNASNETNCAYCHQNISEFNNIFHDLNNTQITHNNGKSCYLCHRTEGSIDGRIHDSSLIGGGGNDCIACHSPDDVNISKFGRHANINTSDGAGNVTNADCWTCHYQKDMIRSNVYLCDRCHTNSNGVVRVNDSSLIKSGFMHGMTTCKGCHAPITYHLKGTVGPLGAIENILRKI